MTTGNYLKLLMNEMRMEVNGKVHEEVGHSPQPCDYGYDWQSAMLMEAHARKGHLDKLPRRNLLGVKKRRRR